MLIDNGRNPMLAYVAMANLILPLLALLGIDTWLAGRGTELWWLTGIVVLKTVILVWLVQRLTRWGWQWRS
jgi:hypothetical protein